MRFPFAYGKFKNSPWSHDNENLGVEYHNIFYNFLKAKFQGLNSMYFSTHFWEITFLNFNGFFKLGSNNHFLFNFFFFFKIFHLSCQKRLIDSLSVMRNEAFQKASKNQGKNDKFHVHFLKSLNLFMNSLKSTSTCTKKKNPKPNE